MHRASLALAAGVFRWAAGHRAMLWPILIFALIQVGVAASVGLRTDGRVARLEAELARDPAKLRADEHARVTTVNRAFAATEGVWIALWLTGAGLALFGGRATLFATGLGLLVEASAMLTLDLAAHRRSRAYAEAIERSG
ncbi:MAG TPA: hypothetical protein VII08_00360 [Myxococcales bacterium]